MNDETLNLSITFSVNEKDIDNLIGYILVIANNEELLDTRYNRSELVDYYIELLKERHQLDGEPFNDREYQKHAERLFKADKLLPAETKDNANKGLDSVIQNASEFDVKPLQSEFYFTRGKNEFSLSIIGEVSEKGRKKLNNSEYVESGTSRDKITNEHNGVVNEFPIIDTTDEFNDVMVFISEWANNRTDVFSPMLLRLRGVQGEQSNKCFQALLTIIDALLIRNQFEEEVDMYDICDAIYNSDKFGQRLLGEYTQMIMEGDAESPNHVDVMEFTEGIPHLLEHYKSMSRSRKGHPEPLPLFSQHLLTYAEWISIACALDEHENGGLYG